MSEKPLALSTIPLPAPPAGTDYEAICATVMATARGRWFLEQYASRTRNSDTRLLLNAIERIESAVRDERSRQADLELRSDLLEMAKTIAQTRAEVTKPEALGCGKHPASDAEPPRDIFVAAERLMDVAWTMRERGLDFSTCAQIEELATCILSASALRDPADRRAQKIGEVLQYLEARIEAMLASCAPTAEAVKAHARVNGVGEPQPEPPAAEAILPVDARAAKPRSAVVSPAMPAELDPPAAGVEPADFLLEPLPDLDSADRPLPRVANFSGPPPESSPPLPSEVDNELFGGVSDEAIAPAPVATAEPQPAAAAMPRAAPSDSLAALMAMAEEERIALFT
jgi:hypothetical protein